MSRKTGLFLFIAALCLLGMCIPFCGVFLGHDVSHAAGALAHVGFLFSAIGLVGILLNVEKKDRTGWIKGILAVNLVTCLLVIAVYVYVALAFLNH